MWIATILRPLKNIRKYFAAVAMAEEDPLPPPVKMRKVEREFDFTKYAKRHVLFMVSYLGWDYRGLVYQPEIEDTIEAALHDALLKTKLIQSLETANYIRCGRTDKGVSAFRQVVSLDVRTLNSEGEGIFVPEGHTAYSNKYKPSEEYPELNYVAMLNRVLPDDIQLLAWASVPVGTSARYHCNQRTYKYFFPKGDLNLEAMREAGQLLVGTYDHRNFCKLDMSKNKVKETVRTINSVTIEEAEPNRSGNDSYDMYVLTINAKSFLWHQIRNIVTVLVLIGQGKEQPDIVTKLLDIETYPKKPQYPPASHVPLVLYDCQFDNVKWQWGDQKTKQLLISKLQRQWTDFAIKAQILKSMCDDLSRDFAADDPTFTPVVDQVGSIVKDDKRRQYQKLLKRPTGPSLEEMQAKCELRKARKEQGARTPTSDMSDSG